MTSITLWLDRENEQLDPRLFSERAERLAKEIADEGGKNRNKSSQLRRYFDEIVRLNTLAQAQDCDEERMRFQILPQVHMLVAKVVYAKGRKLVTDAFVQMMKSGIDQVESRKDLQVFTNFLESFMGFYKLHGPN